jgi:cytochrome c oxidase cbb3-type subunit 3
MEENNKNNKTEVHHVYDGIIEENNPMPNWWVILFMVCIGFGLIYFLHYFSGSGPTLIQEYQQDLETYKKQVEKNAPPEPTESEESLMAFMNGEVALKTGASLFKDKCAMCHGEKLQGIIGPNLTDHFWINGDGTRVSVIHVIKKGSPAKGMPAWEGLLKPDEIKSVAAYIFSKIGSNPSGAKVSEGQEFKR